MPKKKDASNIFLNNSEYITNLTNNIHTLLFKNLTKFETQIRQKIIKGLDKFAESTKSVSILPDKEYGRIEIEASVFSAILDLLYSFNHEINCYISNRYFEIIATNADQTSFLHLYIYPESFLKYYTTIEMSVIIPVHSIPIRREGIYSFIIKKEGLNISTTDILPLYRGAIQSYSFDHFLYNCECTVEKSTISTSLNLILQSIDPTHSFFRIAIEGPTLSIFSFEDLENLENGADIDVVLKQGAVDDEVIISHDYLPFLLKLFVLPIVDEITFRIGKEKPLIIKSTGKIRLEFIQTFTELEE